MPSNPKPTQPKPNPSPPPPPRGCSCCDPTSPSPDPVVVRLEREIDELKCQREMQLEITYQYREQRDKAYGCVRNAIPGDYSNDSIDSEMGHMFQQTVQKEVNRNRRLESEVAELSGKAGELEAEVDRLNTAWRAIDRANESLSEQLATMRGLLREAVDMPRYSTRFENWRGRVTAALGVKP